MSDGTNPTPVPTSEPHTSPLRSSAILGAIVLAAWLVLAVPSWWLDGVEGLLGLSIAATLCLIPGWLVFLFHAKYGTAAPLAVMLSATLGRMAVVLAGALVVKRTWPGLDMLLFAVVLGAFYVLTLTVETRLLFPPLHRGTFTDE